MTKRMIIPEAYPRNPIAWLWGGVCHVILLSLLCLFFQAKGQSAGSGQYSQKYRPADSLRSEKFRITYAMAAFPVRTTPSADGRLSWMNYGLQLGVNYRLHRNLFLQLEGAKNFGTDRTYYSQYGLHLGYDYYVTRETNAFIMTPFLGYNFFNFRQKERGLKGHANYLIGGLGYSLEINQRLSVYASTGLSDLKLSGDPLLYPTNISASLGFMVKLLPHQNSK